MPPNFADQSPPIENAITHLRVFSPPHYNLETLLANTRIIVTLHPSCMQRQMFHLKDPLHFKRGLGLILEKVQARSLMGVLEPYHQKIVSKSYPKSYKSPTFMKFNGKQRSSKEHLLNFIKTLKVYGFDKDLKATYKRFKPIPTSTFNQKSIVNVQKHI